MTKRRPRSKGGDAEPSPAAPTLPGVYVEEVPSGVRPISGAETCATAFVGHFARSAAGEVERVTGPRDFFEKFGDPRSDDEAAHAVRQFFANGGHEAWIVPAAGRRADDLVAALGALDDTDPFNILCIPDTVGLEEDQVAAVAAAATPYCDKRRAFYILDAPLGGSDPIDTAEGMRRWIESRELLRHRNVATYFPRPLVADPLHENRPRPVAPSGTMAGIYARTDRRRGVWKAPAGLETVLEGVAGLEVPLTDAENGLLNPLGVNCLREFPNSGRVCWGSRTLEGVDHAASEWKYVPVRRLALYIEESLLRGTGWAIFDTNDEPLWATIRQSVGHFMHRLWLDGALQGTKATDAYFVKCDGETTTKNDIASGILNFDAGFAPLRPAEFLIIKFQLSPLEAS